MSDAALGDQRSEAGGVLDFSCFFGNPGDLFRCQQKRETGRIRVRIINDNINPAIEKDFYYPRANTTLRASNKNTHLASGNSVFVTEL